MPKARRLCPGAAALAAGAAFLAAERRGRRVLEAVYLQRYWHLMESLSLEALRGVEAGPVREDDEKVIRNYLVLCEDELEMRARGRIGADTWSVWGPGMLAQLGRWPFGDVWREVLRETAPPAGAGPAGPAHPRFTLLREYFRTGADPYRRGGRWTRGNVVRGWLPG